MKKYKLKIIIILFFFYYMLILNTKSLYLAIKTIIINYKIKKQIINLNKYYEVCNKGILINKKKIKKFIIPKISIISPVYNGEKFILRFLRSIQNQLFEDIEIIFVDDFSKDNTIKIIEDCQKKDKRITLIKQKKNKGTLKSRNIGALKAKGEYLIFPDSDDILSNDILKKCYNIAKRYNYDLIRFIFYKKNKNYINRIFFLYENSIYPPQLLTFVFYSLGFLKVNDFNICNKFINRILFLRTLNNINDFYLNQYMIYFEDGFINYALHRNAKSLYLMKSVGYYYITNKKSITHYVNKNLEIKCFLLYLNFLFENSKNNDYEKKMVFHLLQVYINNQKTNKNFLSIIKNLINIMKSNFNFNRFKNFFSKTPYCNVCRV